MTKTISLLGSTGSIGRQTLEVVRELGLQVAALTASTQVDLMEQQIREFHPALAVMYDRDAAKVLREHHFKKNARGDCLGRFLIFAFSFIFFEAPRRLRRGEEEPAFSLGYRLIRGLVLRGILGRLDKADGGQSCQLGFP